MLLQDNLQLPLPRSLLDSDLDRSQDRRPQDPHRKRHPLLLRQSRLRKKQPRPLQQPGLQAPPALQVPPQLPHLLEEGSVVLCKE